MLEVLLFLIAQGAPATAQPVLDCKLLTPRGDALIFAAEGIGTGRSARVILIPETGSAWPSGAVEGRGTSKGGADKFRGKFHFGGDKNVVNLQIVGERATLYTGRGGTVPRAYGFCIQNGRTRDLTSASSSVNVDVATDIAAFNSVSWPVDCALLTRAGRRARIGYSLLENGARIEIKTAELGLLRRATIVASRRPEAGRARFSGEGIAGYERLVLDAKSGEAVQLIDFESVGAAEAGAEPARAICGHSSVVRRSEK